MTDDPSRHRLNPYAAPREAAETLPAPMSVEEARRALALPTRFLFWTSILSLVVGAGTLIWVLGYSEPNSLPEQPLEKTLFLGVIAFFLVIKPAITLACTLRALNSHIYPWAWIATVMSLIPFGTDCALVELLFAFWLLHVLLKPAIRAALSSETRHQTESGSPSGSKRSETSIR